MLKPMMIALGAALMVGGPSRAEPLSGVWGGDRAVLTVASTGARLQLDCARGALATPIVVDGSGRFRAEGSFTAYAAGPQRADEAVTSASARFSGQITGDTLVLEVRGAGQQARTYTLKRGVQPKLVRCL